MEKEPNPIKRIKADLISVLGRADVAMILRDGTFAYSECSKPLESLIKDEVLRSFALWNKGDYSIKRLDRSIMLIGKLTDDTAIAINSVAKLGLLILAFERILGRSEPTPVRSSRTTELAAKTDVSEVEAAREVREADTTLGPSTEIAKATKAPEPMQTELAQEKARPAPSAKASAGSAYSVSPAAVLDVTSSQEAQGTMLDADMIRLLRIVDGRKIVRELAKEASLDLEEAVSKLNFLIQKEILKLKYDEPIYQARPRLNGKADEIEVGTMALGSSFGKIRSLRDLLKQMDGKKTVLSIARELEIDPEKLKVMVENLERRKIIRV